MLDRRASALIAPAVQALAQRAARMGLSANTLTFLAFAVGIFASILIAALALPTAQNTVFALFFLLLSRLLDALDGAVARLTQATDRGGFLDIALDMLFYASVPLAFAVREPAANALPAAVLLAAFIGTGTSFLAYAAVAEKRKAQDPLWASKAASGKTILFLGGLTEATETLLFFAAMCIWPEHFAPLAYAFAALCGVTIFTRLLAGWRDFA